MQITVVAPCADATFLPLDAWSDVPTEPLRSVEVRDVDADAAGLRLRLEAAIARSWRAMFFGAPPFPLKDGAVIEAIQRRYEPHVVAKAEVPPAIREAMARKERDRQVDHLIGRGAA